MDPSTNQLSFDVKSSSSAAPLVPPEPRQDHEQALGLGETLGGFLVRVQARGRQCAEIAQCDREILALREALENAMTETQYHPEHPCMKRWEAVLASTAQAGAEAERRLLEAAWERLLVAFPPYGIECEIVQGAKAAILGTGGEAVDLSKCPKCGGPADNGHDRCLPPNPYLCSKCESGEER